MKCEELESTLFSVQGISDVIKQSFAIRDELIPKMTDLRVLCDQAETKTAKSYWPYPSYADLLFSVR